MDDYIPAIQEAVASPILIFSVVLFAAVFLLVLGGASVMAGGNRVERRLRARVAGEVRANRSPKRSRATREFLRRLERKTAKDREKLSAIRLRMTQAGYMGSHAVGAYYATRILLSGGLLIGSVALLPLLGGVMPTEQLMLTGMLSGALGHFIPVFWVSQRIDKRQADARAGFPDALDMLLICVEAGLSLAAALNRVGEEIGSARPLLGEQFKLVALEMQAGKSREQALRNMADRIGIDEVRSLVTLLLQSEKLGTSIGQSLRVHADEMRRRRLVRAEDNANKLPAKMAIPLVCFILPSLMTVIMTPVVIRIIREVLPAFIERG